MTIETGGRSGTKNPIKIIANIFISFIGAGVLGLPFAFKESGVLEGVIIMLAVSVFSIKAMLLLIKCKYKILENQATSKMTAFSKFEKLNLNDSLPTKIDQEEMNVLLNSENHELELGEMSNGNIEESFKDLNYGDLGQHAMGNIGRWLVDVTILVSQLGFCCAYLIFISENLSSYVSRVSKPQWLVILLPPLFLLTLLRHLHKLALFSFFAQVSNLFAFSVVFWFDFEHIHSVKKRFHPKEFSLKGFPFFFAMAIYCYEGAGMILSLEASCLKGVRHLFNRYFIITISFSTALYIAFGVSGYMSFGPETNEIITLNLSKGGGMNFAMLVKVCLCVSLFFTYPVMLFPVTKLLENRCLPVRENPVHLENFLRLVVVSVTGLIVTAVPNFANLMALVGATCCTLLAFILPGLFHILLFKNSITRGEWLFDCWLIFLGILGTVIGTTDAVIRLTSTSNVPVSSIALNVTNTSDLVL